MPLYDRPLSRAFRSIESARGYLEGYAGLAVSLYGHMALVYEAIREGARADREVNALWLEVNRERRLGATTIVADAKARAKLRAVLDENEAADVVWMLIDPVHFY